MDHGAVDINARSQGHDMTLLVQAYEREDTELVDFLITAGAEVDIVTATLMGDMDRVRSLLAMDPAAARATGARGWTALHIVEDIEVAQLLIDQGADVNARMGESDAGWSVVHRHVAGQRGDVIRVLSRPARTLRPGTPGATRRRSSGPKSAVGQRVSDC